LTIQLIETALAKQTPVSRQLLLSTAEIKSQQENSIKFFKNGGQL
jgi:hypothetical protein